MSTAYKRLCDEACPEGKQCRTISLTRGYVACVDEADYDLVNRYKWYTQVVGRCKDRLYASSEHEGVKISMHRLIMNAGSGVLVDHVDGNGLNNRRKYVWLGRFRDLQSAAKAYNDYAAVLHGEFAYTPPGDVK